jgi:SAM-dependent methyltransferase
MVRGVAGLWDETLYAGSARFYAVGRLPYPQRLADDLRDRLGLDGEGRLLDLGCGPGSLTLLLAPLVREVVALDADSDMLVVGGEHAAERGIANVEWRHGNAEALGDDLGRFDCVTLAQSFHWMDQIAVAGWIRNNLTPERGVCVHVGATTHEGARDAAGLPHPSPPREEITALVRSYLGPHRRAGRRVVPQELPESDDKSLRAAGLNGPERVDVPAGEVFIRTEDEVLASVFSLSSATPHLFGERLAGFEADLRALLRSVAPDGRFAEKQSDITVSIWRP